ncbi:MAG: organic hydroperoxide resistance protein [Actinomycetota bacterium]
MNVLYTAEATAWGGREGRTASTDGVLDVTLSVPKELGGPGGATNPEQLFAAGYAGCFHSALKLIGRREKVNVDESAVTARVGLGMNDAGGFSLVVELEAELPDVDRGVAKDLVEKAHQVCPYSNATRGNIEVTLTVV